MSIIVTYEQGTGFDPRIVRIVTTSSFSAVTTAGWLNSAVKEGIYFLPTDKICIYWGKGSATTGNNFFDIAIAAGTGIITLSAADTDVITPTIANHIATFTNTSGTLSEDPATAISGGNIQAGLSGTAGTVYSYPSAVTSGKFGIAAVTNSSGNFNTTLSNAAAVGQTQVISIPDSGSTTANVI